MAKERRGEPESTSPGPHGMKRTVQRFHKLEKFEKFKSPGGKKAKERVGEEGRRVTVSPITKKEFDGSAMTKEQKAAELTRKMKKGYRKGYRVPKRPGRSSGR